MSPETFLLAFLGFALFWLPASQATARIKETLCVIYFPYASEKVYLNPKIIGRDDLEYFAEYKGGLTPVVLSATAEAEDGSSVEHVFRTDLEVDKKTGVVLDVKIHDEWNIKQTEFKNLFGISPKISCEVLAVVID